MRGWALSRWSKEIKELRVEALEWLKIVVGAFNLRIPLNQDVRFAWGYNTETGLKEISISGFTPGDENGREVREVIDDACAVFNSLYKEFSSSGCEASFHFIMNEEGWFTEMKISAISLPLYSSLETSEDNARRLIEEAKKEHVVCT